MGLTSSMWTSVSGLINHGEKMNVIGNNIANVNTVGFKGQRMDFMDFVYQEIGSASGNSQIGRGVAVGAIFGDFGQGAFETSTEVTDLAISGKGFFGVVPKGTENTMYTRAGNFRFDKDGYLTDPHGYVLQGWSVPGDSTLFNSSTIPPNGFVGAGVSGDVRLDDFSIPPKHTNNVTFSVQLDRRETSKSVSNNPASTSTIDRTVPATLTSTVAGEFNTITVDGVVYTLTDAAGTTNTPVTAGGAQTTHYVLNGTVVTVNLPATTPAPVAVGDTAAVTVATTTPTNNDNPFFALFDNWDGTRTGPNQTPLADSAFSYSTTLKVYDEGGGSHTLTIYFDKVDAGELNNGSSSSEYWEYIVTIDPSEDNRSFEDPIGSGNFIPVAGTKMAGVLASGSMTYDKSGQLLDMTAFTPGQDMTAGGTETVPAGMQDLNNWIPAQLSPNGLPLFAANFSGRDNMSYPDLTNAASLPFMTELNFGLSNVSGAWNLPAGVTSAADIGNSATNMPSMGDNNNPARRAANASTGFGSPNSTILQKQDGYSFGFLSGVAVSAEGVLSGRYSNGIVKELFQLTIFDFVSQNNLRREGGNLFSQTLESGDPSPGIAGNNGNGTINSYSLEQSNVDLSREFTQMITTQRGFQANSKGITTVDTMLDTVIQMKR